MRIDEQGNQVVDSEDDLVDVSTWQTACVCGAWQTIRLDGETLCSGCFCLVVECLCSEDSDEGLQQRETL